MLLTDLEKNALWIIMDPWLTSPWDQDNIKDPNLDKHNLKTLLKIVNYLPKLSHVLVNCPIYENNRKVVTHPLVQHIGNLNDKLDLLLRYIELNNINSVVYTGFHHGQCILERCNSPKFLSQKLPYIKCYIKRDLVCTLPEDEESEADKKSLVYASFV